MTANLGDGMARVLADLDEIEMRAGSKDLYPDTSAWSVAQHLHHTALVAGTIATAIRGLLRGRGEPGEAPTGRAAEIMRSGKIPRGVAKAPIALSPPEDPDAGTIRAVVDKARSRWTALAAQSDEMAACELRVPHPYFGPLSSEEWVRFADIHGRHHLDIVADMLAD